MNDISAIVMFGDLLRTQEINPFYADKTTLSVHELFGQLIFAATGIQPDRELASKPNRFNRDVFYRLAGYDAVSTDNWLGIVSGAFSDEAADYFADCFKQTLVISHEAGALIAVMERRNIPYIDMRVAPIRFMDDIFFAFRTNVPEIGNRLRAYMLDENTMHVAVRQIREYYLGRSADFVFSPGSLLICGQTDVDLSLVVGRELTDFSRHTEMMRRLVGQYKHVYYKPHPMAAQASDNRLLIISFPQMKRVRGNIYQMLCDDNLCAVAALSSGVLHEAPWFDKKAIPVSHMHVHLARSGNPMVPGEYVMIRDAYFSSDFWNALLSPCLKTENGKHMNLNVGRNFLRRHMGMWWDYEIGRPLPSRAQRLCRRLANFIDPRHRLRRLIDPSGRLRDRIKRLFRR